MAADDTGQSKPDLVPTSRIRDPQFREVYANATFNGLSPYDVTMTFAKTSDVAGQTFQVDQVSVTMSPQHYKAFILAAQETLVAYESFFGKLSIIDQVTTPTMSSAQIEKRLREGVAMRSGSAGAKTSSTEKKPPSKRSRGGAQTTS